MDKEIPFVFGRIASGDDFTDRTAETERLVRQFQGLVNTIIISPRRWGKSSLVAKAGRLAMEGDNSLRICCLDMFNVRSEEEFYSLLAQKVIAGTSGKLEEALKNTKSFIRQLVPYVAFGDDMNEVKFKISWEEAERSADQILDLAETVAEAKGIKVMVCIDEFQNLSVFNDSLAFQKKLRSHWQTHRNVGYCLYGSKRHMMSELFDTASKPFYKFGDLMFLDKIDKNAMLKFVETRFKDTGKSITDDAVASIVELADNHPYYVQQLAQMSWFQSGANCTAEVVASAMDDLVNQTDMMFRGMMESYTTQQICYLRAVLDGKLRMTPSVMREYGIASTTSATRSKRFFVGEDVMDGFTFEILDPVFARWLRLRYFAH